MADALSGDPYRNVGEPRSFGVGRDPLDVLRIPWDATFDGGVYQENGNGGLGIALLLTLPLIMLVPRTRAAAFMLALAALCFLGWAYTAQYFRYGLPLLACVAALCGAGIAAPSTRWALMVGRCRRGWSRWCWLDRWPSRRCSGCRCGEPGPRRGCSAAA